MTTSSDATLPDVVALAQALVRIPSLTPVTADLYAACAETLDLLEGVAQQHGAETQRLPHAEADHPKYTYRVDNLMDRWVIGMPKRTLVLLGHTDVVEPGDVARWTDDPYSGVIRDGKLFGRGATDMKGAVAAFFAAIARALPSLKDVQIIVLITTDEEWAAVAGTVHMLRLLKAQGIVPDGVLVGEPSSATVFGSHIKVGRRGSLNAMVTAQGVQGHAAYPGTFVNANDVLLTALQALGGIAWADGSDLMPPTAVQVTGLASGAHAAIAQGVHSQTAIIPARATAQVNVRFGQSQTVELVIQRMEAALAGLDLPNDARVALTPNRLGARAGYLSKPGRLYASASAALQAVCGPSPVADAAGGVTDGAFVREVFGEAVEIVEVGPPEAGGMHAIDEHIRLDDLQQLTEAYRQIIVAFAA